MADKKKTAPKKTAPENRGGVDPVVNEELLARARAEEVANELEEAEKFKKRNSGKDEPVEAALTSKRVVIPAFATAWRRIVIRGTTPILTNAVADRVLDQIAEDQSGKKKEKKPRVPENEYFEHHHIAFGVADIRKLKDNLYGFPAVGIKKALVQTIGLIYGKPVQAGITPWIFINGPYNGLAPFTRKPVYNATHEMFVENRAISEMRRDPTYLFKMGQGKILTPCYRPMFMPWFMTLDIRYNPDVLHDEDLFRAFQALGTLTTFGSYRRSRNGDFGCFEIDKVIELPDNYQPAAKWGSHVS